MKSDLLNEIYRIHQLSGIETNKVLIESNLILEAGAATALERLSQGIEKMLDRKSSAVAERFVSSVARRGESLETSLIRWIRAMETTIAGKQKIVELLRDMGESSTAFAEKLVKKHKDALDSLVTAKRNVKAAKNLIKINLGDNIANAWEKSRTKSTSSPKPVTKPVTTIPTELKNKDGVKGFQDWLDKTYPDWIDTPLNGMESKGYGKYGTKTKKAWETYGAEYLERIKKGIPTKLNEPEKIKKFQDWLDKTYPDWTGEGPLNGMESKGYGEYTEKTKAAFEKYGKEFSDQLPISDRIFGVDYAGLDAKELTRWENFMNSNSLLIPQLKLTINLYLKAITKRNAEIETVIDDIFSKLKTVEEQAKNLSDLDSIPSVQAIYNDILSSFQVLRGKPEGPADIDGLFRAVRETLEEQGVDRDIASKIEDGLRKVEKELPKAGGPEKLYNAKIPDFLASTSYAEALRELKRAKGFWRKLWAQTKRTLTFLSTGSVKNLAEWREFILKSKNPTRGVFYAWLYLQLATKIGVPLVLGVAQGLLSGSYAYLDADEQTTFKKELKKGLQEQFSKVLYLPDNFWNGLGNEIRGQHGAAVWFAQQIVPIHNYFPEMIDLVMSSINSPIYGQIGDYVERLLGIGKYKKDQLMELWNAAGDREIWFKTWCMFNNKIFKEFVTSSNGNYGVTNDGKKWKYNESTKGFDEIKTDNSSENQIDIERDIKPAAGCLFDGGWTVSLVETNGQKTYITHNQDKTEVYELIVTKTNGVTKVVYKSDNQYPC